MYWKIQNANLQNSVKEKNNKTSLNFSISNREIDLDKVDKIDKNDKIDNMDKNDNMDNIDNNDNNDNMDINDSMNKIDKIG